MTATATVTVTTSYDSGARGSEKQKLWGAGCTLLRGQGLGKEQEDGVEDGGCRSLLIWFKQTFYSRCRNVITSSRTLGRMNQMSWHELG